jgi:uncharacterized protein (DUF1330 family)
MASYFVAHITITDPEGYERYLGGFDEVFERFHGEVVAVDDKAEVLEGAWDHGRTVIIRFPSETELLAWYRSPEYQALAEHRRRASTADIALVHGRR